MHIARHFTTAGRDPYEAVAFRTASSEIRNPDGSVVFQAEGFEVPAEWSQVATDILAQKYFRKAGVPARLAPVAEQGLPPWLWRRTADPWEGGEGGSQRRPRAPATARPPDRRAKLAAMGSTPASIRPIASTARRRRILSVFAAPAANQQQSASAHHTSSCLPRFGSTNNMRYQSSNSMGLSQSENGCRPEACK
jgi:Class II vitamin B12-dependent ribonucleotide reductase